MLAGKKRINYRITAVALPRIFLAVRNQFLKKLAVLFFAVYFIKKHADFSLILFDFFELEKRGIAYDVCPGVSAFCGAAAALRAEYTLPDVSQTVIITRAPGRTPVPERESIRSLAAHQATMVLFLSTSLTEHLQAELLAGGYAAETPAAVVYKATWPEEKIFRCTVGTLHETVTGNGLTKTSLIVVGSCLGDNYLRSLLYHPDFTTEFRKGAQ